MRNLKFLVITLGLALTVAACGAPPKADIDAAKAAMDSAVTAGAGEYAAAVDEGRRGRPGRPGRRTEGPGRQLVQVLHEGQGTRRRRQDRRREGRGRRRRRQGNGEERGDHRHRRSEDRC